jgi:hypothetical protein
LISEIEESIKKTQLINEGKKMNKMTCDNDCVRAGWTEAMISNDEYDLHVSHAPDSDMDGAFLAFCHDEQEMISIAGWQIAWYEQITAA